MLDTKLYSLLKVYECGSFGAAAKKLSITQPAVSHHIKALEEELGVCLFDRQSGGIIVTREGEAVIKCAKKMLGLYNGLRQDLQDGRSLVSHLTVGVTHTAESNPIAEALAMYCDQNDDVTIKIITGSIKNLYNKLKSYEVDLAVVEGRIPDPGIHYLPLGTDSLVLAVSARHPFAGRNMVTLNELKRERMILRLPNSGTRNLFTANLESNNLSIYDFNVVLELDNIATIKELIRQGFGVSILPKSVCLNELKTGEIAVLPVENLSMMREINLAYQKEFSQVDVLRGIADCYHDALRSYFK
ncbi:MAG TPA: LysR family transcriptional regulator [Candidatus Caccousia avistercoris]|nr:LysR family transcriptional regulator [Candidatus Caccousia avistercoris]